MKRLIALLILATLVFPGAALAQTEDPPEEEEATSDIADDSEHEPEGDACDNPDQTEDTLSIQALTELSSLLSSELVCGGGGCPQILTGTGPMLIRTRSFYNNKGCETVLRWGNAAVAPGCQGFGYWHISCKHTWTASDIDLTKKAIRNSFFVNQGSSTVYYYDYVNQHGTKRRRKAVVEWGLGVKGIITSYSYNR